MSRQRNCFQSCGPFVEIYIYVYTHTCTHTLALEDLHSLFGISGESDKYTDLRAVFYSKGFFFSGTRKILPFIHLHYFL